MFWKYACFDEDTKAQGHDEKDQDWDSIQDLSGRSLTGGRLRKAQEALQNKVAHLLEAQQASTL